MFSCPMPLTITLGTKQAPDDYCQAMPFNYLEIHVQYQTLTPCLGVLLNVF